MKERNRSVFDRYQKSLEEMADAAENAGPKSTESLQFEPEETVLRVLKSMDWSFSEEDTAYLSHDIHPYPAKFAPQIPAQIMKLLSSGGEKIWDPFGGSGTTALEALLNDRSCVSTDINPIGNIIGKAKTTALCAPDEAEINRLIERLEYYIDNPGCLGEYFEEYKGELEKEIPEIPNMEKWFSPAMICELAFLKYFIKRDLSSEAAVVVAYASFSKIITRVSNQENETTYRAVEREVQMGEALEAFLKDLKSNFSKIKKLRPLLGYRSCEFITADVMQPIVGDEKLIGKGTIDLIITSPPYPNAFDYHLYHRFRIFWLDRDPREVGKAEIGSHLNYQKGKKGFDQFEKEMAPVLENCYNALKAGRYAVFILGNAVFEGVEYKTAERMESLAEKLGFTSVGMIDRPLPETKRSVKSWARRATTEQILILRKPAEESKVVLYPVRYKLWPYEKRISDMERSALCRSDTDSFTVDGVLDIGRLKKLTFYSSFQVNDTSFMTWQNTLENGIGCEGARKDPKYLTHGIHPYKGKFYPQLVKPLLSILKVKRGGVVFDPFCGSGTVALESILNGYNAYGCDINPTAVDIAIAKNTIFKVGPYEFDKYVSLFKEEFTRYADGDYCENFDKEAMEEICSWFPKRVISKMGFILSKISAVPDERIRRFLKVILSSVIREISQQEPSDLRIRRRKDPITDAPVIELFTHNLDRQYRNIMGFYKIRNQASEPFGEAHIWQGNARYACGVRAHLPEGGADIVISSPPYATALPYIDTNRLNMLVLNGYNASKRIPIEAEMTGTREINKSVRCMYEEKIKSGDYGSIASETARQIIQKVFCQNDLAEVGFRKKNMAALLYMYFRDMSDVLNTINDTVKAGGYACLVIGDTKTTTGEEKVIIKTTQMLRETADNLGWELLEDIPISVTKENYVHMNNSITENNILIFKK